jgi:hypothetical protein
MIKLIKAVLTFLLIMVVVDVFVFGLWIMSGQRPPDDFFIGAITNKVVKWIVEDNLN